MTAAVGGYFDNMQQRFRRDFPGIGVRSVPTSVAASIGHLSNDASVTKPVDDLYVGTRAGGDGFLFVRLFRGQVNVLGQTTDVTDYDVLLAGFGSGTPSAAFGMVSIGLRVGGEGEPTLVIGTADASHFEIVGASAVGEAFIGKGYTVGFLPQEPKLDPARTVIQVVEEGVAAKQAIALHSGESPSWLAAQATSGVYVHLTSRIRHPSNARSASVPTGKGPPWIME
jgi:hypothetical protein